MLEPLDLPESHYDKGPTLAIPAGTIGAIVCWMEYEGWSRTEENQEHNPRHHAYLELRYRMALISEDHETLRILEPLLTKEREWAIKNRQKLQSLGTEMGKSTDHQAN